MTIIQMLMGVPGSSGAQLEFIGASHVSDGENNATLTYPAGIAAGDLMVFVGANLEQSHPSPTGGGWVDQGGVVLCGIYTKTAAGTESGAVARTLPAYGGASIYIFRGAALVDSDVIFTPMDSGNTPAPSSVATNAGQLHVLGKVSVNDDSTPSGYTPAGAGDSLDVEGIFIYTYGYIATLSSAGSTPTPSFSESPFANNVLYSIVIGES